MRCTFQYVKILILFITLSGEFLKECFSFILNTKQPMNINVQSPTKVCKLLPSGPCSVALGRFISSRGTEAGRAGPCLSHLKGCGRDPLLTAKSRVSICWEWIYGFVTIQKLDLLKMRLQFQNSSGYLHIIYMYIYLHM